MRVKAAVILLTLFVSGSSLAAYADPTVNPALPAIDPSVPAHYSLGVCETPQQLDCIQNVYVKDGSGDFRLSAPLEIYQWNETTDPNTNKVFSSGMSWTIPQLAPTTFQLDASVRTPSFIWNPDFSAGRLDVGASNLPRGYSVKVAVRTSWIKAQNLQFISDESSYTQEPIAGVDGAYLWTFTGTHARVSTFDYESSKWLMTLEGDWSQAADIDHYSLDFVIHHAGVVPETPWGETSWWDPRCSDHGFTAQAFNSHAAGSPEWIDGKGLEFNIFAPHYDSRGAPHVNQGFFRLWIHEEFAECQWPGNTLVGAEELEALIVNEDGSEQNANIIITNEGGMIYLEAVDFHYSVPTFIIRPRSDNSNVDDPSTGQSVPRASAPTLAATPEVLEETPNPKLSKSAESEKLTPSVAAPAVDAPDSENPGILALMVIGTLVISTGIALEILRRRRAMPLGRRRI